jgi:membrane-bound serine protease (ClpP class)
MGAMVVFVLVNLVRIRMMPVQVGVETLIGHEAVVRSLLDPEGFVFLEGETWTAESEEGAIQSGERVVITEVQGLRLKVRKQQQPEGD